MFCLGLLSTAGAGATGCDGSNYTACRARLVDAVFGTAGGALPTRASPDYVEDLSNWTMRGLPGPGQGTGVGKGVAWKMGLQKLTWTIGGSGGGMPNGMLRLNATVWYSRNTTGDAPSNSPPVPLDRQGTDAPHCPDASRPGFESWRGRSDTLVLHHNGHSPCSGSAPPRTSGCSDCTPNFDTAQDWLNQLGYDVMELAMPLHGCNRIPGNASCGARHCISDLGPGGRGFDCSKCVPTAGGGSLVGSHEWFAQFEAQGDEVMRYFLEPVVLATNYALDTLGYRRVVMVGLSGGGWTTTVAAALDPRISLSMPIAGSMPKFRSALYPHWVPDLPEGKGRGEGAGGDFEQNAGRKLYGVCGWACLYVLAAYSGGGGGGGGGGGAAAVPPRHALQMVHEHDSCCFAAAGLHANISAYNAFVQAELLRLPGERGWFQTAANLGNYHEINYRDKVVVGTMIERLRRRGGITRAHFDDIPFDVLGEF